MNPERSDKKLITHLPTHVALLRGVNVGGKHMLPMKLLAQMFVDSGCRDVRTYLQSGNVVFSAHGKMLEKLHETITKLIPTQINNQFGFRVPIVMRTAGELEETVGENPYLATAADRKTLHVMFLDEKPDAGAVGMLDAARSLPDAFSVCGRDIYLNLPNGVAKSKLTNAYFDSKLSTISTSRNWATVLKLAEWLGTRDS